MSASPSTVTEVQVESVVFPPEVKPPGSDKTFFLGGAGLRGGEYQGKYVKITVIGVYLENSAVTSLAAKWKGKSAEELADSVDFFAEIVTGPFEKIIKTTTLVPLTGQRYSEKVAENCIAHCKSIGKYTDAEAEATRKFLQAFKNQMLSPGTWILFTQSLQGSLAISFSKDSSIPEKETAIIENKQLSEAVLETMIGKKGVSPATKQSLAARLSDLLKQC